MSPMLRLKFLERLFVQKTSVVEKDLLTDARMSALLGKYTDHVVVYNFDKRAWNCDYYLWRRIMSSGVDCSAMKRDIERCYPQIELAAVVGIATRSLDAGRVIDNPRPATPHDSNCLAYATLIVRDKGTGQLRKSKSWIKLSNCPHPAFVAEAMPQLLSGVGRTTVPMTDVDSLVKERQTGDGQVNSVPYTHYQKVLRKYTKQMKKSRNR